MIGKFTKNDVTERVPSIGKTSVENALRALLEEGVIGREGKGKATFYFRKKDEVFFVKLPKNVRIFLIGCIWLSNWENG